MAQSFWLECANFARVGDQSARPAVEAARQDLRGFAQLSPVERIGQELSGEWANLAHLIGSLAICSVNNQVRQIYCHLLQHLHPQREGCNHGCKPTRKVKL